MDRGLGTSLGGIGPASVVHQRSSQLPSSGDGGAWLGSGGGGGGGGGGGPPLFRHSAQQVPVVEEEPPPEALLRKAWSVAY